MDLDKVEKLGELKEKGMITQEEYDQAKAKALGSGSSDPMADMDNRSYSMLMHFSQLFGYLIPMCGWIVPLILWVIKRDDPYIDQQGKVVFNWIISSFIYFVISLILTLLLVGFVLIVVLGVVSIVFIVIGAIRARDGRIQNYPLSIPFFTIDPNLETSAD